MPSTSVGPRVWTWSVAKLRNSEPQHLLRRLRNDIKKVTAGPVRRRKTAVAGHLSRVVAALLPEWLENYVSISGAMSAAHGAEATDVAFCMLNHDGEDGAKMRVGLAIAIWLTGARRSTLNVVAKHCKDDPELDQNLAYFLNPRRVRKFKEDLRLTP